MKDAQRWLEAFAAALSLRELAAMPRLFHEDSCWRDLVALTWNIRTSEGPAEIQAMLAATLAVAQPANFKIISYQGVEGGGEAWFTFETAVGRGKIGRASCRERVE